jgi:hypothetical protein
MSLAGMGVIAIWHDVLPEAKDEFYEWHSREHMPERVGIPGFRRGRRYLAVSGAPEFFVLYEADSAEVLVGQDYLNRLNAPTDWTKRILPSMRNMTRSICRVAFTSGVGGGGVMRRRTSTSMPRIVRRDRGAHTENLPPLAQRGGIAGVHLGLTDVAMSKAETEEVEARTGEMRVPAWVVMIEGNSVADVRGAHDALAPGLQAHNASAFETAIYRHELTRLKTPWSAG